MVTGVSVSSLAYISSKKDINADSIRYDICTQTCVYHPSILASDEHIHLSLALAVPTLPLLMGATGPLRGIHSYELFCGQTFSTSLYSSARAPRTEYTVNVGLWPHVQLAHWA